MNPSLVSTTEAVDAVFLYIFGISVAVLLGVTATMIWFLVKYNRKRNPRPLPSPRYNLWLETVWTVIPTILVLTMFWYGWSGYTALSNIPEDALRVKVTGRMWSWSFEYPNGRISDKLYVPVGRAIRLDITSEDVLHSFYVPAFRIKKDAVPGMTTHEWFRAPEAGSYDAFCAEYCGVGHSGMITTVEALPAKEFADWLEEEEEKPAGRQVLEKYGCLGCHSLDGTEMVGPTFRGLFGKKVTVVSDGRERTLTADAEYVRRSILQPQADVVKGFPPVMPSFQGRISDQEIDRIVAFLKEEASAEEKEISGEKLAREKGCVGCHSTDGTPRVGPTWKGLYGKQVTVKRNGEKILVTADEDYLRKAVTEPNAELVEGFPPVMPRTELNEEELEAVVDYIKSLK